MKFIFIILATTLILSCNLLSKSNKGFDKRLLDKQPELMTVNIPVTNPRDYKKIIISGRCEGGDGPRSFKTKINIENKDVIAYDVWSDSNKSLLERSIVLDNGQPTLFTYLQSGCAHHGFTYTFKLNEKLSINNPEVAVKYALDLFKNWQVRSLFKEERIIKIAQDHFLKNKIVENCQENKKQILCSYNNDPENLELQIKNMKDNVTEISMNYWFVL